MEGRGIAVGVRQGREGGRKRRDIAVIVEQMKGKREGHCCRSQTREGGRDIAVGSRGRRNEGARKERDIAVGVRQRKGGRVET